MSQEEVNQSEVSVFLLLIQLLAFCSSGTLAIIGLFQLI